MCYTITMILKSIMSIVKDFHFRVILSLTVLFFFSLAIYFISCQAKTSEENYPDPDKQIQIVVPFAPGGKIDIMFRRLAKNMKRNGVNIEVKNVPGMGGITGIEYVLKAEPDGYTLLASSAATIMGTFSGKTEGYNRLTTVAGLNEDPFMLVTRKGRFKDFQELRDCAEVKELTIVTAGVGTLGYKVAETLCEKMGSSFKHCFMETDGGTGERDAVYSGLADIGIITQFEVISDPYMQPLVILTGGHSLDTLFASVPTINEQGISLDIPGSSFCSVMVRKDIPPHRLIILEELIEEAYYSEDFQNFQKNHALLSLYLPLNQGNSFFQDLIHFYQH